MGTHLNETNEAVHAAAHNRFLANQQLEQLTSGYQLSIDKLHSAMFELCSYAATLQASISALDPGDTMSRATLTMRLSKAESAAYHIEEAKRSLRLAKGGAS